nr:MAG TPA: hypothetical protein [Caudoviricetes sp.]
MTRAIKRSVARRSKRRRAERNRRSSRVITFASVLCVTFIIAEKTNICR